jgi:hypothetical protein
LSARGGEPRAVDAVSNERIHMAKGQEKPGKSNKPKKTAKEKKAKKKEKSAKK